MGKKETGIEFGDIKLPRMVTNPSIPYGVEKAIADEERKKEELSLLRDYNKQLESNYKKLEEIYNLKAKKLEEATQDAKKAKRYNTAMMIITVVSMLVAVAAWLLPDILGGAS